MIEFQGVSNPVRADAGLVYGTGGGDLTAGRAPVQGHYAVGDRFADEVSERLLASLREPVAARPA